DNKTGTVAGDGSDAFPGGVFHTTDGGKTWRAAEVGSRSSSWRAMDFTSNGTQAGILGGTWSRLATIRVGYNATVAESEIDPLGGRTVHAVKAGEMTNHKVLVATVAPTDLKLSSKCFAVGDGGLVLISGDFGKKWGFANLPLSPAA